MKLVEYVNPNGWKVELTGPDKKIIIVPKFGKVVLPEWYGRYAPKFLRFVRHIDKNEVVGSKKKIIRPNQPKNTRIVRKKAAGIPRDYDIKKKPTRQERRKGVVAQRNRERVEYRSKRRARIARAGSNRTRHVGRRINTNADKVYRETVSGDVIPISDNIGVGILSFNRLHCIQRLIQSIRQYTDLSRTTIFISDESTNQRIKEWLKQQKDIILLDNQNRLGIAKQSNKLLTCLSRFKYKLLLNDDVEVLDHGWEKFYINKMEATGYHHFCYREPGIYGAREGDGSSKTINGVKIHTISDKPHGAVMALDHVAFEKVGFFDENYGPYGFEHVDWSNRVGLSGLQPRGFHDVEGSYKYFQIHNEPSSIKKEGLRSSREKYHKQKDDRNRIRVPATDNASVPSVSIIIPCRTTNNRFSESIESVINNIRGQRFPNIEIIVSEQDKVRHIKLGEPYTYHLAQNQGTPDQPFNKSIAFNKGVMHAKHNKIILHDADIAVKANYIYKMSKILDDHEACHIGNRVMYLSRDATDKVHKTKKIDESCFCEHLVGYFEGGSLGCRKKAYVKIGGFNESFIGYGCFSGSARVLMHDGTTKAIKDINVGDKVVTHLGRVKKVTKIMSDQYNGKTSKLDVCKHSNEFFVATPNHRFKALHHSDIYMGRKGKELRKNPKNPYWIPIGELSKGDLVERRRSHNIICDINTLDVLKELEGFGQYRERNGIIYPLRMAFDHEVIDGRSIGLQRFIDIDNDFMDLLGYYAAEGCADPKNGIRFSIHEKEFRDADIGNEIIRILIKYGLTPRVNPRGDSKGRDIQVFCVTLAYLLKKWFPNIKNEKKLPEWVMYLPSEKQLRLLIALFRGDAQIKNKDKNSIILRMGSRSLVDQAVFLLERCGFDHTHCSPYINKYTNYYSLSINYSQLSKEVLSMLSLPEVDNKISYEHYIDNATLHRIRSTETTDFDSVMYNITVEEDHSYIVNGMVVENCEDCDFFMRLKDNTKFMDERTEDFIHLWHGRSAGWDKHHKDNKRLMSQIMQRYTIDKQFVLKEMRRTLSIKYAKQMKAMGVSI